MEQFFTLSKFFSYLVTYILASLTEYGGEKAAALLVNRNRAVLAEYGEKISFPTASHWAWFFLGILAAVGTKQVVLDFPGRVVSFVFFFALILIALLDWKYRCIFDDCLLVFAALGLLATPFAPFPPLLDRGIAAVGAFAVMFVLALIGRGAMGGGDVKLMAVLGLWLGTQGIIRAAILGFLFGGVAAAVVLVCRFVRKRLDPSRDSASLNYFAFGPYLCLGAFFAWMVLHI